MSAAWRRGRRASKGKGEIRQRDLVKNALRMRPDRVILGECRGEEAFDMLQAMNTGHEGSMATIHANTPRDAISRLEQMIGMAGLPMTVASIRGQIAAAIRVIVQLSRLSDGKRRVMSIAEITGLEGDIIQMQEIFKFVRTGTAPDGAVQGHFQATGVRPRFLADLVAQGIKIPGAYFDPVAAAVTVMAFDSDFDPIYLVWLFVAISAGLAVEAVYLLCFSAASYRSQINRRLMLSKDRTDRESVLIELRRERGLTAGGDYRLGLVALNRLILQSGLTIGIGRLADHRRHRERRWCSPGIMVVRGSVLEAGLAALFCATVLPLSGAALPARAAAEEIRRRNFPMRSTSSCAACAPGIRCPSPSPWWGAK